ncbi:MAG: hypothetical protein HOK28_24855 [Deltaproteobacteria bacterium]|nr:hypothetical protein [Deltaproteobacteria bacterium]
MRDFAAQSIPASTVQNSFSSIAPPKDLEIKMPKANLANQHPELATQDAMQAIGLPTTAQQAVNPTTPNLQPVENSCGVSQFNGPTQTQPPVQSGTTTAPTAVSEPIEVQAPTEVAAVIEVEEPEPTFGEKVKGFFDKVFTVLKELFNFLKNIFSLVMPFMGQLGPLFGGIFGGGGSGASGVNPGGSTSSSFPGGSSSGGSSSSNSPSVPVRDPGTTFSGTGTGSITGSSAGLPTGPVLDRPRILG